MYFDKKYTVNVIIEKVKNTSFIKKNGTNWGMSIIFFSSNSNWLFII
jgi:hypothetical protein